MKPAFKSIQNMDMFGMGGSYGYLLINTLVLCNFHDNHVFLC